MRVFLQKYAAASCLALVLTLGTALSYAQESDEYGIKAVYTNSFIRFVKWPDGLDTGTRSSIDICVIGDSEILQKREVYEQASTAKLSISLVQENNPENIASHCHIVFIGEVEPTKFKDILAVLRGKPVLTVGDSEGFADRGGMVGFVMVDGKIKLVVNPKPAVASGLRLDAQLLEAAIKVIGR